MKKLLFLSFCLFTYKSFGQDSIPAPESLIIDRFTNHIYFANYTATVIPKKALQLDVDAVYTFIHNGQGWPSPYQEGSFPDLKFRYGLFENIELRAGTRIGYSYQSFSFSDPTDPFAGSFYYQELFLDYLTLGIKANILKYNRNKGHFSFLAESYVPALRAKEVLTGHFLPTITFINSDQLNEWLGYNVNFGAILNFNYPGELIHAINICLTPVITISNPVKAFAGINILMDPESSIYNDYIYHAGLIYTPAPRIQLKGAVSLERHPRSPADAYHSNLGLAWQITR